MSMLHDEKRVEVAADEGVAASEVVVDDDGDPDLDVAVLPELLPGDGEDGRLFVGRKLPDHVGAAC